MARLILSRGRRALLEFPLRSSRVLVGRADNCDLVVPSELVSRTHCVLSEKEGCWSLVDRSKHGTFLKGARLEGRHRLEDGQTFEVGAYRMRFVEERAPVLGRTVSQVLAAHPPEQLVAVHGGELAVERPLLTVLSGAYKGQKLVLEKRRQTLGGTGSDLELSERSLLPGHAVLTVSRSRTMLSPGTGLVYLDGERVLETTPLYLGEQFMLCDTVFELGKQLSEEERSAESFGEMVGSSQAMKRLFGLLIRMAQHTAPVLLMGESGCGKELAARGLHTEGFRSGGPFVAINCGAISEKLFESELFGHEKGAFTDAKERTDGAFQRANRGTLFLDEVGELPLAAQTKLLRALETGEVRRVGGASPSFPDVRVVAATNRDLEAEVKAGRFREDLFFRLAVLGLRIPPLRERKEDIPNLARALCAKLGEGVEISPEGVRVLECHPFPGNVRELRNVLTRAYVLGGKRIEPGSLSFNPWANPTGVMSRSSHGVLKQTERAILLEAFERLNGNRSAMARELGVPRTTLHYKLKRFGIRD